MPRKKIRKDQLDAIKHYGKLIRKSWPKNSRLGRGVVIINSGKSRTYEPKLIKGYYPYMPLHLYRFITTGGRGKLPKELLEPIVVSKNGLVRSKILEQRRRRGAGTPTQEVIDAINIDEKSRTAGQAIFFPKRVVKYIYTEKNMKKALRVGITPEALEGLTKSKLYVKEIVKEMVGETSKKELSKEETKRLENWKEYIKRMESKR